MSIPSVCCCVRPSVPYAVLPVTSVRPPTRHHRDIDTHTHPRITSYTLYIHPPPHHHHHHPSIHLYSLRYLFFRQPLFSVVASLSFLLHCCSLLDRRLFILFFVTFSFHFSSFRLVSSHFVSPLLISSLHFPSLLCSSLHHSSVYKPPYRPILHMLSFHFHVSFCFLPPLFCFYVIFKKKSVVFWSVVSSERAGYSCERGRTK